jgi:hypothetical protein
VAAVVARAASATVIALLDFIFLRAIAFEMVCCVTIARSANTTTRPPFTSNFLKQLFSQLPTLHGRKHSDDAGDGGRQRKGLRRLRKALAAAAAITAADAGVSSCL